MDRSVHPTTTISEDVGFLSKVRWIEVSIQPQQYQNLIGSLIQRIVECPWKHTNFMTSPTYGGDCFLVGFPDQFPANISESTERMLAGEWSGRLAGKYSPLQIKTYEITQQWRS